MFLISSTAPNTRKVKLSNEHKSRNNHCVIGLCYTIGHTRNKHLINNLPDSVSNFNCLQMIRAEPHKNQ